MSSHERTFVFSFIIDHLLPFCRLRLSFFIFSYIRSHCDLHCNSFRIIKTHSEKIRSGFEIRRSTQSPCDLDRLIDIISRIHQHAIHHRTRPSFAELEHPGTRRMRGEKFFYRRLSTREIPASPHGIAAEVGCRDGRRLRIITLRGPGGRYPDKLLPMSCLRRGRWHGRSCPDTRGLRDLDF